MQMDILDFTKKLLSKCIPIPVQQIHKSQIDSLTFKENSDFSSMLHHHLIECIKQYFKKCESSTITNIITPFNTQYYILCISKEHDEHLMIGPFLEYPITENLVYSIVNKLYLNLNYANKLRIYYQSIPSVDTSMIFEVLYIINEYLTKKSLAPNMITLDLSVLPKQDSSYDLIVEDMNRTSRYKSIEETYAMEDKLLSYIKSGDVILAQSYFEKYMLNSSNITYNKDSIRNIKNLLLSANTLFRKTTHIGGVHPIYLDELSRKWATKIEQATSFEVLYNIMEQMIPSYCLLIKKYSLTQYSSIVQKALTFINLNISSNLTVKKVASEVGLSADYLTRLFKKELDMNVITYINKKRIYKSLKLLGSTNLSIEEIGDLVGLDNTSYFYKLFKKEIGISPKQYRNSLKTE